MSSAPTGWTTPVTNRVAGHVPTINDFNIPEANTNAIELGDRTLNPALAGRSITGTLRQFLSWFAGVVELITGVAWPGAPPTTLTATNTHITATTGIHGAASAPNPNTLVFRNAAGNAQVAVPVAAADIARLDTVVGRRFAERFLS